MNSSRLQTLLEVRFEPFFFRSQKIRLTLDSGPDAQDGINVNIETSDGGSLVVRFFGSELRLRGNKPVVQPHRDEVSGDVFCWNGEVSLTQRSSLFNLDLFYAGI